MNPKQKEESVAEVHFHMAVQMPGRNGETLMIEARIYAYDSGADNQIWIDDLNVSSSNANAEIFVGGVAIPAPGALALLGLAGLGRRRRNG